MTYDPDFRHRRSLRLKGYDYSRPGAYFVTICTHNRDLLLDGEANEAILNAWLGLPARFPAVRLNEFVIMPNHVHGIIVLGDAGDTIQGAASSAPTLGEVVRAFKSVSAIEANKALDRSGRPFWQRNYYEHVIRDELELDRIREYIRDNPLNWDDDPDNPRNL